MTKASSISPLQLLLLTVGSALMFPYTFMPVLNTYPYNQDVWAVLVVSLFYIVIFNLPLLFIMIKFRGLTINEIFDTISGSAVGKALSIIYVLLFLMCYSACLMVALQFVSITLMPSTPMWALLFVAIIPITYIAIKGAGVIGRLATFIVPLILITIIVFALAGIKMMEFDNLKPILADSSFLDINLGAMYTAARFSEISIFLVFSYFLRKDADIKKNYFLSVAVFAVFILIMVLSTLLVLGYDIASICYNPYYIFTRQVQLYESLEKVQALNLFVWFPGTLLKLSIYCFMAAFVLNRMFKKVSRKKFAIGLSALVYIICSIKIINNTEFLQYIGSDRFFPYVIFAICFVIPLILVAIYFMRKKKINEKLTLALKKNNDEQNSEASLPS
ncbi:MAG: hypothetical protein EOM87_01925 [Clostridia bacterium]|nr:hypothetical protein [Clostridia bacterium]